MSTQSKNTITSMVVGFGLLVAYGIYAGNRFAQGQTGPDTLQSWALAMLIFIGISVVALILVQIVFRIVLAVVIATRERSGERVERMLASSLTEDEMDRLIIARAARVGSVVVGIGFIGLLAVLALGGSAVIGLHVLFGAFAVGSLAEGAVTIAGYERGVRHG